MSLVFEIPGARRIELTDLVVDVNGTLTNRGELLDGVRPRLRHLSAPSIWSRRTRSALWMSWRPEGASPQSLAAADLMCDSITDALELLADPRALAATLRP